MRPAAPSSATSQTTASAGVVARSIAVCAASVSALRPCSASAQPFAAASSATASPTEPLAPVTSMTGWSVVIAVSRLVFGEVGEAGDARLETQPNLAGGAVALLG